MEFSLPSIFHGHKIFAVKLKTLPLPEHGENNGEEINRIGKKNDS
jgi:hypothetical protein